MNDTGETITLRIHGAISEVAPEAWDACAGDINPTVSHAFLKALEESGSLHRAQRLGAAAFVLRRPRAAASSASCRCI